MEDQRTENLNSQATTVSAAETPAPRTVSPQHCPTCGTGTGASPGAAASPSYVYAIGRIEPRFPRLSVEKEFAQAVRRDNKAGATERQTLCATLSKPENRYLVRQMCWVMTVEGLETYLLVPRDTVDFGQLLDAVRPNPNPLDLDVVIGIKGPIAPPDMCNGLMIPIVAFDLTYSFDRDSLFDALLKSIHGSGKKPDSEDLKSAADELFDRIVHLTDNAGATDENRALNYIAVRYHRIYEAVADAHGRSESLTSVDVRASALSGTRKIVEVVFSFTNRNTDVVSKQFVRVDVTEEFPFLVSKLSPYFDR